MTKELLHFSATWCQPCKAMQPILDKFLADNPDIAYTKYDADADVSVFQDNGITGVPAFIVKKAGSDDVFHKGLASETKLIDLFA